MKVSEKDLQEKALELVALANARQFRFSRIQEDPIWSNEISLIPKSEKPYFALKDFVKSADYLYKQVPTQSIEPRYAGYCSHNQKVVACIHQLARPVELHVMVHEITHMLLDADTRAYKRNVSFCEQRAELTALLFTSTYLGAVPDSSLAYIYYYRNRVAPDHIGAASICFQLLRHCVRWKPKRKAVYDHKPLGTKLVKATNENEKLLKDQKRLETALKKLHDELSLYPKNSNLWCRAKGREQTLQAELASVMAKLDSLVTPLK